MATQEKKLSREDAAELYKDLRKTVKKIKSDNPTKKPAIDSNVAKQIAQAIREGMKKDDALRDAAQHPEDELPLEEEVRPRRSLSRPNAPRTPARSGSLGQQWALSLVVLVVLSKIAISGLEVTGVLEVPEAQASLVSKQAMMKMKSFSNSYSPEEVAVLKALDAARIKLEKRKKKVDMRERQIGVQEEALVARLSEVRGLTEKLKVERKKTEGKRNGQLEQLSNVYGSMNPTEAAQLIEQLDVTIALKLLERMPEKRIGQILSLMNSERALTITRMLSGGRGSQLR